MNEDCLGQRVDQGPVTLLALAQFLLRALAAGQIVNHGQRQGRRAGGQTAQIDLRRESAVVVHSPVQPLERGGSLAESLLDAGARSLFGADSIGLSLG